MRRKKETKTIIPISSHWEWFRSYPARENSNNAVLKNEQPLEVPQVSDLQAVKQSSSSFPLKKYEMPTFMLKYHPYRWKMVRAKQGRSSAKTPWQSKTNYFFKDLSTQPSFFTLDR